MGIKNPRWAFLLLLLLLPSCTYQLQHNLDSASDLDINVTNKAKVEKHLGKLGGDDEGFPIKRVLKGGGGGRVSGGGGRFSGGSGRVSGGGGRGGGGSGRVSGGGGRGGGSSSSSSKGGSGQIGTRPFIPIYGTGTTAHPNGNNHHSSSNGGSLKCHGLTVFALVAVSLVFVQQLIM